MERVISSAARAAAERVVADVEHVRDSVQAAGGVANFNAAADLVRSMNTMSEMFARGLYADSARFNRTVDQLAVSAEYIRGLTHADGTYIYSDRTPALVWHYYHGLGLQFQPVETIQSVLFVYPTASTPTASMRATAEALHRHAVWYHDGRDSFPIWEYQFAWNSGGVTVLAPWRSGMAQGLMLMLDAELFRRTQEPVWRTRAYDVFRSMRTTWDHGGVMLDDTTYGYWWEEYHPAVRVWNGAAGALVGVGHFRDVTGDPEVARVFQRGLDAMKHETPYYDTGSWTLYSRTQGYNSRTYHALHVRLADLLYAQSGDPFWRDVAQRWRAYTPPPGVL